MEEVIVKRILKLTETFYQRYAEEFSNSRSAPWKGWDKVTCAINKNFSKRTHPISIVDLGSGNCRLYSYLTASLKIPFKYLGLDKDTKLIEISRKLYKRNKNFTIAKADVIEEIRKLKTIGDVVCAFGLTHHIPSVKLRNSWFNSLPVLVKPEGILVLSFWNTTSKSCDSDKVKLDKGSKFLGWKGSGEIMRYVHRYNDREINDVIKLLKVNKFQLLKKYVDDINSKSSNLYLIFKKQV